MSVIAAVGFNTAAIAVHGVQLSQRILAQGIRSLEQNAPISQHIYRKKTSRSIRERYRLLVTGVERGNFQREVAHDFVRIYKAVRRNIERPDAIVVALRDLVWRSGRNRDLPYLPVVARSLLSRKQHIVAIEGDACIRSGDKTENERPLAASILDEDCGATGKSFGPADPSHRDVFARDGVQQR